MSILSDRAESPAGESARGWKTLVRVMTYCDAWSVGAFLVALSWSLLAGWLLAGHVFLTYSLVASFMVWVGYQVDHLWSCEERGDDRHQILYRWRQVVGGCALGVFLLSTYLALRQFSLTECFFGAGVLLFAAVYLLLANHYRHFFKLVPVKELAVAVLIVIATVVFYLDELLPGHFFVLVGYICWGVGAMYLNCLQLAHWSFHADVEEDQPSFLTTGRMPHRFFILALGVSLLGLVMLLHSDHALLICGTMAFICTAHYFLERLRLYLPEGSCRFLADTVTALLPVLTFLSLMWP